MTKSLGTNVYGVDISANSYVIKYNGGDECFYQKNQENFTSELRMICDHDQEEGWPR